MQGFIIFNSIRTQDSFQFFKLALISFTFSLCFSFLISCKVKPLLTKSSWIIVIVVVIIIEILPRKLHGSRTVRNINFFLFEFVQDLIQLESKRYKTADTYSYTNAQYNILYDFIDIHIYILKVIEYIRFLCRLIILPDHHKNTHIIEHYIA